MKNLDTISKRILVISVSIAIVALSISVLLFSVGHAFASNETPKVNAVTNCTQTNDNLYPEYQAIATQNSIIIYNTRSGVIYNVLCPTSGYTLNACANCYTATSKKF